MDDSTFGRRGWSRARTGVALGALLTLGAVFLPAVPAGAKKAVNVFTMKGSYSGTITLNTHNCVILKGIGGTYSGPNSYTISLNKLKVAIPGLGMKSAYMSINEPKAGTFHVGHGKPGSDKNVSITDKDGPDNFSEISGTVNIKGSKGSVNLVMEYEPPVSMTTGAAPTYSGSETVTGSWSCAPSAFNIQ
jgi:hypothetical protein